LGEVHGRSSTTVAVALLNGEGMLTRSIVICLINPETVLKIGVAEVKNSMDCIFVNEENE
jgi:hypothetical protein